jgi:hypothetical protein
VYIDDGGIPEKLSTIILERINFPVCIVTQSTSIFYSPFPALPAPKIAGLLPSVVPTTEVIFSSERKAPALSFPTPAELDLDIYTTFLRIAQRMAGLPL